MELSNIGSYSTDLFSARAEHVIGNHNKSKVSERQCNFQVDILYAIWNAAKHIFVIFIGIFIYYDIPELAGNQLRECKNPLIFQGKAFESTLCKI